MDDIAVVVFDLDDTLCPERLFVKSGFRAVSSYVLQSGILDYDIFPELWSSFCSGGRGTVFNDVLRNAGVQEDEKLIAKLVEVYRLHHPEIVLYPDARFILHFLRGKKKMGLLSDGYLRTQQNKIEALGIAGYFDVIVLTDALGRACWKPHTAGYEKIMESCGAGRTEFLYIGDNPKKDFYGARRLGWRTVQVVREEGIYAEISGISAEYRADMTVRDLYALTAIVQ